MPADRKQAYALFHEALPVMAAMKIRGVRLDFAELDRISAEVKARQDKGHTVLDGPACREFKRQHRRAFDPGSHDHQRDMFFGVLKLQPLKPTAKGRGYSTDEESLQHLLTQVDADGEAAALVNLCLSGAKDVKLAGVVKNFRSLADAQGYMHPSFSLHTVTSYRSSCFDPNFQNVPVHDALLKVVRRAVVPRRDWFVEADMGGAEICGYAMLTKDARLIRYIRDGVDFHRRYAAMLYEKDEADIAGEERQRGKSGFMFPKLYGSGVKGIIRANPQWRPEVVERVYKEFERDFTGVTRWQRENNQFYGDNGFVQLPTGFRCAFGKEGPLIFTQTSNMPCQGFVFHRLLRACVDAENTMRAAGMESEIVGQIHDSIFCDVADAELEGTVKLLQAAICRPAWGWDVEVPWVCEVKIGRNMLDMEKI